MHCGVPDGFKAFAALKKIVQDSYEKTHSIAVALDGPPGAEARAEKTGILSVGTCRRGFRRYQPFLFFLPAASAPLG